MMTSVRMILQSIALVLVLSVPSYGMAGSRDGVITMEFDLSRHPAPEETRLWIPYPVSDAHQTISNVKVTGDYAEAAVYTDKVHRTAMLFARWDGGASSRKMTFSFAAERDEVSRRDLPAQEAAWDPADYALYLAPTSLGPTDGPVRALADKITAGKKGVLEKAKAIYDWTCENT
ncbi:MAG: transglutaminase, partial [Proteobacteria bacterium]|nr:transglutaminase [Pseudomonadota bacterium]